MAKLSDRDLRALLAAERASALASIQSSKLSDERSTAMDYYLGDVSRDIPSIEGRSRAVSHDVSDTIEGMLPQLMEIFAGADDVVRFDPVGPEDVEAAEQESEYVNYVFTQRNPGFLVLYSFIKDALLSKVGVVKVWWQEEEREERETYFDLSEDQFGIIAADTEVEIIEHTAKPDPYMPEAQVHDVTVVTRKDYSCAKVEGVPPEEFGISRNAKSIRDANYCFHETLTTEGDLIEQGYDANVVKALPSYPNWENDEKSHRDTVEEDDFSQSDSSLNTVNRPLRITEHYCRMDYDGTGAALWKVVGGGEDSSVILTRGGKPDIERVDAMPFAAMTPVIITHRFFGRSIADLVMDIMRIKTVLVRGMLDNLYLHNNPRVEVAASHSTQDTLDDLLVSRPGGMVRTAQPGGVNWQVVPDITQSLYPALQYFDATREWRTGVSRQGQGLDANALQNQTATAANQLFSAAQARIKLIARIFAETGIKDMFLLLHSVIRKNTKQHEVARLRNNWVAVDPRAWASRYDMTVNVGLGTGSKQDQLTGQMALISLQQQALAAGKTNLVSDDNLYNSAKAITKILGHKNVDEFFTDPKTQPPPQPPPDPKMMEIQAKAEIEKLQAQADIATQDRKTQAELTLMDRKFQLEREIKLLDAQMNREKHQLAMASTLAKSAQKTDPETGQTSGPDVVTMLAKLNKKPSNWKVKTPNGKVYEMNASNE